MAELKGKLTPIGSLSGRLSANGELSGALDRVIIQPEIYTGPTLIIPGDSQQILDTNGKQLTDDIIIEKIPEPELVRVVCDQEFSLADTNFPNWTPSTTAAAIKASQNITTEVLDMAAYEYILKWETSFFAAYQSGATMKAQVIYETADQYQQIRRQPNSLANIQALNYNSNTCTTYFTCPLMRYYTTAGASSYAHSLSYGIYPALVAATFSNSTSLTPTMTVKTPTINARCNSSYFAVNRAAELDQANSKIHLVGKLYKQEIPGEVRAMYEEMYQRYISEGAL